MESHLEIIDQTYGNQIRVRISALIVVENRLLLVKQKTNNSLGYLWLAPGGGLQFGESMVECLKRETLEETGLQIASNTFYGVSEYIKHPLHAVEIFYSCSVYPGMPKIGLDPELDSHNQLLQELKWFKLEEIKELSTEEKHFVLLDVDKLIKLFEKE